MRRFPALLATALVAAATLVIQAEPADAYFLSVMAIGSPFEDVGAVDEAGAVHLIGQGDTATYDPSDSITVTRATIGGTPVAGDRFGTAVELVDVNDDNARDLIIGAPGIDRAAGRVYVIRFLPMAGRFAFEDPVVLRQGVDGLMGTNEAGDRFGATLNWTPAGEEDPWLAIGAPGEDVRSTVDAGAVTAVRNATDVTDDAVYYQGHGIPGTPERGDRFGAALATFGSAQLAVGAPGEDVGAGIDAGNVTTFSRDQAGSGAEYHQGEPGVPGESESGDRFGAALASRLVNSLSIGVPGEDIGAARDAGAVVDLDVPDLCCVVTTLWYQGHNGLSGTPETGDRFGAALAGEYSFALVVGAPGEDVGDDADAGIVHLIETEQGNGTLSSLGNQQFHQDRAGVPGTGEDGDELGGALGEVASSGMLVLGMSREDVHAAGDAGAVIVLGLDDEREIESGGRTRQFTQDDLVRSTAEPGDRFGASFG